MRCLLTAVLLALQTLKKDDSESRNLIFICLKWWWWSRKTKHIFSAVESLKPSFNNNLCFKFLWRETNCQLRVSFGKEGLLQSFVEHFFVFSRKPQSGWCDGRDAFKATHYDVVLIHHNCLYCSEQVQIINFLFFDDSAVFPSSPSSGIIHFGEGYSLSQPAMGCFLESWGELMCWLFSPSSPQIVDEGRGWGGLGPITDHQGRKEGRPGRLHPYSNLPLPDICTLQITRGLVHFSLW